MPSLAEYQQAMHDYLLAEEAEQGEQLPATAAALAAQCSGDPAATAARLLTYRCRGTLVNALRLSYPAVRYVLGADCFDAIARQFVCLELPRSACLNDYGADFAAFAAESPATAMVPYLCDLARLEWAVNRALHAPDTTALCPTRLQTLAPEALAHVCFRAHPSVSVLALRFPAERIWQSVLERDEARMASIDLSAGAGYVLIERDASHAVQIRRLCKAVGCLSERLFAGEPLYAAVGAALEAQGEGDGAQPEHVQAALADHLACGRLVSFHVEIPRGTRSL